MTEMPRRLPFASDNYAGICPEAWEAMRAANGGYAFKMKAEGTYDPKDTGVNNAGALKGAEMLTKLVKEGVMPKGATYADMEAGMAQGKIAMMISGPWAWDNLKKAKVNFGVAKVPSVGGKPAAPFVGYMGAMITKAASGAGNADIAREFIDRVKAACVGQEVIKSVTPGQQVVKVQAQVIGRGLGPKSLPHAEPFGFVFGGGASDREHGDPKR